MRVRGRSSAKWGYRRLEMPLLKLRQAQIQLHAGQLRIQRDGLFIRGSCFLVSLLFREDHAQAGKSSGIAWILLDHPAPDLGSFGELSLLFEGNGIGRAVFLCGCTTGDS